MTKFFLIHVPGRDEYMIKTIGSGKRFRVLKRTEGQSDEDFKQDAIRQFDELLQSERALLPELANGMAIIKSEYIL